LSGRLPTAGVPFRVLVLAELDDGALAGFCDSPYGPFTLADRETELHTVDAIAAAGFDAVVIDASVRALLDAGGSASSAVIAIDGDAEPAAVLGWTQAGAHDVIEPAALTGPVLARRTRLAIERQRLAVAARRAYSTDSATGLPHREQFVEHVSHLLALREREPSPMAVLGVRVEGLSTVAARYGASTGDVLRRRVAVRLRASVRASDVVASIGEDRFAVLLGSLLTSADAERVAAKVLDTLLRTFSVGGNEVSVALAIGKAAYPEDGVDAEQLLSKALALAAATPAEGRSGFSNFHEHEVRGAANDD
jgi:diguanylate cyclase (GGDEF)-like protein